MTEIQTMLFAHQDVKYREFHSKLMPNINPKQVIGVRVPVLRKIAKELRKSNRVGNFLQELPHTYYEENNLHAFLIGDIKEFDACMEAVENFLPYIDNWATCDGLSPKVFGQNLPALETKIEKWIASEETYTIRFGIGMLMRWFLEENFSEKYLDMVIGVKSEEYYVNMMRAWYFATALAKQYDATLPRIQGIEMDKWTHNKAIQKAVESYRITPEQKELLKKFKIK